MSIQHSGNFNGHRMVSSTYDSIDNISERVQKKASDMHASVILRDQFWQHLQDELTRTVGRKRQMLAAGGYTDAAQQLRTVENLAIRTAIEEFRADTLDVPERIHDDAAWDRFRSRIREHATTTTF